MNFPSSHRWIFLWELWTSMDFDFNDFQAWHVPNLIISNSNLTLMSSSSSATLTSWFSYDFYFYSFYIWCDSDIFVWGELNPSLFLLTSSHGYVHVFTLRIASFLCTSITFICLILRYAIITGPVLFRFM